MSNARSYRSRETVLQEIQRGDLCAILVEGEETGSDAALLKYILRSVTTEVVFFGRDGRPNVLLDLKEIVPLLPADRVFAIVDRDFESDELVEECLQPAYLGHAFFWRRYTIENYLLEPAWILEAIQYLLWQNPQLILPSELQTEKAIETLLLDLAQKFLHVTCGNAVISSLTSEQKKRQLRIEGRIYFNEGTEEIIRAKLVSHYSVNNKAAPDLFSVDSINQLYDKLFSDIQPAVQSLNDAHCYISGKLILNALHQKLLAAFPSYKIRRINIIEKLMELASKNPPTDFRLIVEERILPRWRNTKAASQA